MIINLIKSNRMFSLTLPTKVKGQYWVNDLDTNDSVRMLLRVEAADGKWVAKSSKLVSILDKAGNVVPSCEITDDSYFLIKIGEKEERAIISSEAIDKTRQTLSKIAVTRGTVFTIGRDEDNNFRYNYEYVSGHHAKLMFDGEGWAIEDVGSRNGTFVNGYRVQSKKLEAGDFVYIMGLKIVIGSNYIAINNPDELLKIHSDSLRVYNGQELEPDSGSVEIPNKEYFVRAPRFVREIEHKDIKIDPPPAVEKIETVPMALMLGPSLTMGFTSVSTGIITVMNTMSSGGNIKQALPTLIMSVSMLIGTVLWPILTKKYEKKNKIKSEKLRQDKYLAYLNGIGDQIRAIAKEQNDILQEYIVSSEECIDRIARRKENLWDRTIEQKDFLRLRLGVGDLPIDLSLKYQERKFTMEDDTLQNAMLDLAEKPKILGNVPISVSLVEKNLAGIFGEKKLIDNFVKQLILQMVSLHSYDELKIILVTDEYEAENWNFVKYIPHFWSNEKDFRFFATTEEEVKEISSFVEKNILSRPDSDNVKYSDFEPYYVVICSSKKHSKRFETLQSLLEHKNNCGFSAILFGEKFMDFPKETNVIIEVAGHDSKIYDKTDTSGKHISFEAEQIKEVVLDNLSYILANTEMDILGQRYSLPNMLTFLEMFNVSKVEHLNALKRWSNNNPTKSLQTPVGVDTDGDIFNLDLHEKFHGPHGLVAGMTGSGKSEFIITYILSLAVNYHPNEVSFILIDYKGGGLTGAFEDTERGIKLPHLAGTITNLDGASIKRSLVSIQSELRRRQALFNYARKVSNEGTMDIYKYQKLFRDNVVSEPVPHLFIISDEFAELKAQQPEFMEQLISTARIGRSLGVHLILATQKPNGVVDDQIWSNSKFRVCLKVQDKSDSQDMIKRPDAAELSQTGRFYLQVGFNEFFALGQSAWCGAEYTPTDTVEKAADESIQVVDNLGHIIMDVKPQKVRTDDKKNVKQVVAIVKYLSDMAEEEQVSVRSLWLPPIPAVIFVSDLEEKYHYNKEKFVLNPVVGEYDDPFNQKQGLLTVPLSTEGNCLVFGATGNGKTTFLTTLCFSLISHHSADEVNIYIMDFGAETLKVFEKAPQVGGVVTATDEEKISNLLKMLKQEIDYRKGLFSEFGGDYSMFLKNSGKSLPNIVVVINNFAGFSEQYEDYIDDVAYLTRECVKYGIYFVVSASAINAVRYKVQQNFKMTLTMQLNDPSDYYAVVGKTEGLVPTKFKGRGLVLLDKPYEFQTAYCKNANDIIDYIRQYCVNLTSASENKAKRIPILPKVVNMSFVEHKLGDLKSVPVGVSKTSLEIECTNISGKSVYPITGSHFDGLAAFAEEFVRIILKYPNSMIFDAEKIIPDLTNPNAEQFVVELFKELVKRNNDYKDAGLDESVLDKYEERTIVVIGFKKLFDMLSDDGKDKLTTLLEKDEVIYKVHFVIIEEASKLSTFNFDNWYKRQVAGGDGLWIGDGITDQYIIKVNKLTSAHYSEIGDGYGYVVSRGKTSLVKLLSTEREEQ